MRKKGLFLLTVAMSAMLTMPVFAGQWQHNEVGWWWTNDDGSYPTNCWQWIDGNNDGIAESYYFGENGYCCMDTTTPDNYTVDASGAWTINGIVQTQVVQTTESTDQTTAPTDQITTPTDQTTAPTDNSNSVNNATESDTVFLPATGKKYHKIPNCGRMNPAKAREVTLQEAIDRGFDACDKCY